MTPPERSPFRLPEREGPRVEFKRGDVLDPAKHPRFETLLRSVVAMWNAGGGKIFVGVEEMPDGRPIPAGLPPNGGELKERFRDALVGRLDPPPLAEEVRFHERAVGPATVLELHVRSGPGRGPACVLAGGGQRIYLTRYENRNRQIGRAHV